MENFRTSFLVFVYTYSLNLVGTIPDEGYAYVFDFITFIVLVIGLVQFIGWVVPSCVCTNVVLDGIINKLQYSVFHVKRAMNKVSVCVATSILGQKWHLDIFIYLLMWLFKGKVEV